MPNSIYIVSQPIQTGKTTRLLKWVQTHENIGGILTPDVDGKRKLYDIGTKCYADLQLKDNEEGIRIGRFVFETKVFAQAQAILIDSMDKNYDWIVVDEIGRLEMDRKEGLEPAVSQVIQFFKTQETNTKLLLVIRDYLLADAKKYYGLEDAIVVSSDFFLTTKFTKEKHKGTQGLLSDTKIIADEQSSKLNQPITNQLITGIVLCGGQSVRMGRDKAFIKYHNKPQYAFVADMMNEFCNSTFISCNATQKDKINQQYQLVLDSATLANAGPMTGVLSAFEQLHNTALLVIGCDYPHYSEADMKALIETRDKDFDVVCYHHLESGFDEPLLAIYEKKCAPLLLEFYQKGNTSLQQFLKTVRVKRIFPENNLSIKSIDS